MDPLVYFTEEQIKPDAFYKYPNSIAKNKVPIVIDNGSYKCRAGWATSESPQLIFKCLTAKQKSKKTSETEMLVGNDISNYDQIRYLCRTQFEKNIVTQFDVQENIFDYIFSHLQISSDSDVPHPIVMTEPTCNPNYCREKMSELLFESYQVPSVAYGIDALFGLRHNNSDEADAEDHLVVSCGYNSIHVIPMLDGKVKKCRRFNFGGATVDSFMMRSLQLKYPGHVSSVTLNRAEYLVQKHCRTAVNFNEEVMNWTSDAYYKNNVIKVQLPYNHAAAQKISADQQKERQMEQIKRLRDMNLRRRQERLISEQEKLAHYASISDLIKDELEDDEDNFDTVNNILYNNGLASLQELQSSINKLNESVQLIQDKITTYLEEGIDGVSKSKAKKAKLDRNKFVDMSTMPASEDLRAMEEWLDNLRIQRQGIISSMNERKAKRAEMMKRRTAASQNRMKILSQLSQTSNSKKDDKFGARDEDWDVYKEINLDGKELDSENELDKLEEIETCLQEHDPEFKKSGQGEPFDIKEYYQLHVALEQIRIPEVLFQPSMLGIEQAGISEGIEHVLKQFSADEQQRLVKDIFLTGGGASLPNFLERLHKDVREIRPFNSEFNIRLAQDPVMDAWNGARSWAVNHENIEKYSVSRQNYLDCGGDYIKENFVGNLYLTLPASKEEPMI